MYAQLLGHEMLHSTLNCHGSPRPGVRMKIAPDDSCNSTGFAYTLTRCLVSSTFPFRLKLNAWIGVLPLLHSVHNKRESMFTIGPCRKARETRRLAGNAQKLQHPANVCHVAWDFAWWFSVGNGGMHPYCSPYRYISLSNVMA